jgi:(p)ppGpp synthase/HD superfamily hydrolase
VAHLLGVGSLVLEHGGDEEQAAAGLLHDILKECGLEHEEEISARFGARVTGIIRDCVDIAGTQPLPWRQRKEAHLQHLAAASEDALLVSACDKLHNARAIVFDLRAVGPQMMERFDGRIEGRLWYYGALMELYYKGLSSHRLLNEFALEFERMQRLSRRSA